MLYALSKREIAKIRSAGFAGEFTGAEILFAIYKTDADVVKKILPKPLKPAKEPLVTAFVAHYPQTNFGCSYNEGAILIHAMLGCQTGVYCISMPVDDDMAMIYGREIYGYPKKLADIIRLERTESKIAGSVSRKGVEILRIELEQQKPLALSELSRVWNQSEEQKGRPCQDGISFLYKNFLSPDGKGFDYIPRLVRQTIQFRPRADLVTGEGRVIVQSSAYDPLGDIPVRSMVSCLYGTWDNTMVPGKVVSRAWNVFGFLPYAFCRTDLAPVLLSDGEK
jgi:acetoacetate decarboxylase